MNVRIPPTGDGLEDVHLVEWLVADGDQVEEGQGIFAIESDKSVVEVAAPAAGRLSILAAPGAMFPPGTVVAVLE